MVSPGFIGFLGTQSEADDPNLKASMAERFQPDSETVRDAAWTQAKQQNLSQENADINRTKYLESGKREVPLNMEDSYFVQDFTPQKISEEDYRKSGHFSEEIPYYDGMTADSAKFLSERLQQNQFRDMIMSRATTGQRWQGVAMSLGASFTDPWNVMSSFVPVPLISAKLAASVEASASFAGRAGYRAAQGAAEGAFGAAIMEPFQYGAAQELHEDYTAMDSLKNVAIGTFLGSALHTGTGMLGEAMRFKSERALDKSIRKAGKEFSDATDALEQKGRISVDDSLEVHSLAVSQLAQGKTLDVEAIMQVKLLQNASEAEQAKPFSVGEPTGEGNAARFKDYAPVEKSDLPYLQSVVNETKSETPWVKEHNEAVRAKGEEKPAERGKASAAVDGAGASSPRAAGILTPENVAKVAKKIEEGKPLGKKEAEIAKVIGEQMEAKKAEAARIRGERATDPQLRIEKEGDVDAMLSRTMSNEAYAVADHAASERIGERAAKKYEYDKQLEADIAEYESRLEAFEPEHQEAIRDELSAIDGKASAEAEALKLANVCMRAHV